MTSSDSSGTAELVARLKASEELYARAFMSNPVAMSITDLETSRFTHINVAFSELVGYTRSEILGRTSEQLKFWPDRARRSEIGPTIKDDDSFPLREGSIRTKNGDTVGILFSFRLLPTNGGAMLSVLVPLPRPKAAS